MNSQTKKQNSSMKVSLLVYCQFGQDDLVLWLTIVEFAYNNYWQKNTPMIVVQVLLSNDAQMSYKDHRDLLSKFPDVDKNKAALFDLIKELKMNQAGS